MLYPGLEIIYNPNNCWDIFGFFHAWKWRQPDRFGYSLAVANLVFVIGKSNNALPYIDEDVLPDTDVDDEET